MTSKETSRPLQVTSLETQNYQLEDGVYHNNVLFCVPWCKVMAKTWMCQFCYAFLGGKIQIVVSVQVSVSDCARAALNSAMSPSLLRRQMAQLSAITLPR